MDAPKNCQLCPRSSIVVNPEWNPDARIAVVVEAPTYGDTRTRRLMSGRYSELLPYILRRAGIDEADVFVSSVARCWAPKPPVKDERDKCMPYLVDDLDELQPQIVIAMGPGPLHAFLRTQGITKFRGSIYTPEEYPFAILPTFGVDRLMERLKDVETAIRDFAKAKDFINGKLMGPTTTQAEVGRTLDEVKRIRNILLDRTNDFYSFGFETTSQNPRIPTSNILCASFSNEVGVGYVIPLLGQACRTYWEDDDEEGEVTDILREILASDVSKVASNGNFDRTWAKHKLGVEVNRFEFDTQLAFALLSEESPHGLEYQRTIFTNMYRYDTFLDDPDAPRYNFADDGYSWFPEETLWQYAAANADCKYRVAHRVMEALDEESRTVTRSVLRRSRGEGIA